VEADAAGGGEGGVPFGELFPRVCFIVTNLATSSLLLIRVNRLPSAVEVITQLPNWFADYDKS